MLDSEYFARPRCTWQIERRLSDAKGEAPPKQFRFDVGNSVEGAARLAHTDLRPARLDDFKADARFTPEQVAVFAAAARGYCMLFDGPAQTRSTESGRDFAEFGIRF